MLIRQDSNCILIERRSGRDDAPARTPSHPFYHSVRGDTSSNEDAQVVSLIFILFLPSSPYPVYRPNWLARILAWTLQHAGEEGDSMNPIPTDQIEGIWKIPLQIYTQNGESFKPSHQVFHFGSMSIEMLT